MGSADPHQVLLSEPREHALVIGGRDAVERQAGLLLRRRQARPAAAPLPLKKVGELVAAAARELGATAVGGMTMGADPVRLRCARRPRRRPPSRPTSSASSARSTASSAGSRARSGSPARPCLVVEDVETSCRLQQSASSSACSPRVWTSAGRCARRPPCGWRARRSRKLVALPSAPWARHLDELYPERVRPRLSRRRTVSLIGRPRSVLSYSPRLGRRISPTACLTLRAISSVLGDEAARLAHRDPQLGFWRTPSSVVPSCSSTDSAS